MRQVTLTLTLDLDLQQLQKLEAFLNSQKNLLEHPLAPTLGFADLKKSVSTDTLVKDAIEGLPFQEQLLFTTSIQVLPNPDNESKIDQKKLLMLLNALDVLAPSQ